MSEQDKVQEQLDALALFSARLLGLTFDLTGIIQALCQEDREEAVRLLQPMLREQKELLEWLKARV